MSSHILIVTGGRDFADHELFHTAMAEHIQHHGYPALLCHGAASGADTMAADWAVATDTPCQPWPAEWHLYGRRAGPLRNGRMVGWAKSEGKSLGCAVHVLAFPGGRGTADCIKQARAEGLSVTVALEAQP